MQKVHNSAINVLKLDTTHENKYKVTHFRLSDYSDLT